MAILHSRPRHLSRPSLDPHRLRSGRERAIARFGEGPWKGIYSLVSAIGFVLIVWGFARARHDAPQLWTPLPGARHITMLLDARRAHSARELSLQAQPHHGCGPSSDAVGGAAMERWASHRQRLGCGPCAVRRLLVWSAADLASSYARDRRNGVVYPAPYRATAGAVVVGLVLYAALLAGLHLWLFGVSPLAG